jgi:hypothetical protein
MADQVAARLDFHVDGLAPDHPLYEGAVEEFLEDARETPGLSPAVGSRSSVGTKGGLSDVFIQLGSSTAFTGGVVAMVRSWLKRDRHRSLTVTIIRGDEEIDRIEVSGENVSLEALEKAIEVHVRGGR